MLLWERIRNRWKRKPKKVSRQQRRKLQRDLLKLRGKINRKAEQTLKNERIPKWIREVKRKQLEEKGLLK